MYPSVTRWKTTPAALLRTTALSLLAVVAAVGVGAGPALAADGNVAWTVRTASNSYGEARSSYSYNVNPGGAVEDAMVVANHGKAPLTLSVYAADGFTTDAGQLDLLTKDKKSVAIGAWVKANASSVVIQPGKTAQVPFTLSIPGNATPGDYVGGILTALTQADQAQGINVDRRLGIRIKLRVGGELKPNLAIEDLHVTYAGSSNPFSKGDATITYKVHNVGNAALSGKQAVTVAGPFGLLRVRAGDIAAPPELLPGESWNVTVPVHDVAPTISLAATATLTPLLTDASGSTTSLKPVAATAHGWALPWMLLLVLVVLIAVLVGAYLYRRRTQAQRKAREDARVRDAVEQALRGPEPQTS
ncbi:WxL protein peptidoglycan domain-containing protein [Micromonospora sp. NPDC050276]|uniref:WxL protein peptidoglycan domain-containing protein n=1 Tax=Micromonospora sp. NPDC050276 TaxID=3364278 RepID=UPI0037AC551B